ncbi:MAG: nucleoside hydrolase [Parasporobacterium sp.]|nr:nucleoside hydrolase [Parasporobacterium sp.]
MLKMPFEVPENRKIRVIIDTDAGCECDDQYAIAHALMSSKVDVRAILAEQFAHIPGSMEMSYEEICRVCDLMGQEDVRVLRGSDNADVPSEGSRFIIEEAGREDIRPLFILCQGALTNIAAAIKEAPEIQNRVQLVVISGAEYPKGRYEFNTMNDADAFNYVMNSEVSVWMIPEEVYSTVQVGLFELKQNVEPCGKIGKYLYEKTLKTLEHMAAYLPEDPYKTSFEKALAFPNGESWSLGDSPALGVLLMHNGGTYDMVPAPNVQPDGTYVFPEKSKLIRLYKTVNTRFIIDDFFAKLNWFYKN